MTTPGHLDKRGSPLDIACCHCGRCLIEGRQFGRRFGSRVQGGNNWQCRLTSGKVVADRLSRHTRVTPDADQIVDALKRKTQLMAKTLQRSNLNRPGMSGDSSSWKGWGHVRWFIEEVPAGAA